ncbi:FCD domain-containing protein [Mesorhizobium sp. B2-8-1]|nr:FCD domain-containing protein [Mesorhizobium sp. CO1-1-3]MBZ9949159.1 FCD domain-containing protein [Mesorhizobium sp. BR1-1-11]TPI99640.1 FCD domain-containing protein [Mesorhizobium sp. B2-8-1]
MELPTVRLAVERMDDAGIQRLRRLVEAQRQMTHDPIRIQISDAEFHDAIYRAGGNPLLADFRTRCIRSAWNSAAGCFWRTAPCH